MESKVRISRNANTPLRRILRTDEMSVIIPLIVIIALTTIVRPDFLTIDNFSSMFTQIPYIAIIGLAISFPIMTGNIDISVGKTAGFAGVIMSMLCVDYQWSAGAAILFALLCGAIIGVFNGILVVHFGVPDFVGTMGTYYMIGGARFLFIKGYQFSLSGLENFVLDDVFAARYLGMPLTFWIMIVLFVVAFIIIKRTLWGRKILATGDNKDVASLAGINVKNTRMIAYIISGVLAAVAGLLLTLDMALGLPENGDGWEFRGIAGCVVGGVSLSGGKGSPLGVLLGVTLIFVAESAIIFIGLPATMRTAVQGVIMAAAVLYDIFKQQRKIPA